MKLHMLRIKNGQIFLDDFKITGVHSYNLHSGPENVTKITLTIWIDENIEAQHLANNA